jgi:integrase
MLRELRARSSNAVDLVFPSPNDSKKPLSENTMRKLLQTHYEGATVHGMRAAFRTWAAEVVDARDDVAEMALAHTVGSETVRAYNRTEWFHHRRELIDAWGMWVEGRDDLFANGATDADRRQAVMRRRLVDEAYEEAFFGDASTALEATDEA